MGKVAKDPFQVRILIMSLIDIKYLIAYSSYGSNAVLCNIEGIEIKTLSCSVCITTVFSAK